MLSAYLKSRSPVLCVNVLSVFCECPGGRFFRQMGWLYSDDLSGLIYNKCCVLNENFKRIACLRLCGPTSRLCE